MLHKSLSNIGFYMYNADNNDLYKLKLPKPIYYLALGTYNL